MPVRMLPTMLLSSFIGLKISEVEFSQNVLLYTFSWPKHPWLKSPGQNVHGYNVLHLRKRPSENTGKIKDMIDISISNSVSYRSRNKFQLLIHIYRVAC